MQLIGSPENAEICVNTDSVSSVDAFLTDQVVGRQYNAACEQNGRSYAIMETEDYIINNGFISKVPDLHKPGHRWDQAENSHFWKYNKMS